MACWPTPRPAHGPRLATAAQEDWKASRTDAWLRKARRDALLLVGLRAAVWSFIILLVISVNVLVLGCKAVATRLTVHPRE